MERRLSRLKRMAMAVEAAAVAMPVEGAAAVVEMELKLQQIPLRHLPGVLPAATC